MKDYEFNAQRPIFGRTGCVRLGVIKALRHTSIWVTDDAESGSQELQALSLIPLEQADVGQQVSLGYIDGVDDRPVILGKVWGGRPAIEADQPQAPVSNATYAEPLEITSQNELTLRCGKASITLTKEGKIILRGTYISSRSSGPNRIKGGSVHLN